jgi:predicted DNA-binding protein (UPF0251 family)
MPRCKKTRRCAQFDGYDVYKPVGVRIDLLDRVFLEMDELEAVRLCDLMNFTQDEAGAEMGISRGTVQRLLKKGRAKIADALIKSKVLIINKNLE